MENSAGSKFGEIVGEWLIQERDREKGEMPGARQQWATRAVFFIGGFGTASWAPLVPLLKARLAVDEDVLGQLLLCIGFGSLLTMPLAGMAAARFGCRRVLCVVGSLFALMLLGLCAVSSIALAVPGLLVFGALMGLLDVSANIHAILVEKASGRRLMSGLHAMWSVGGFVGAGLFGIWMVLGLTPFAATACAVGIMLFLLAVSGHHLLRYGGASEGTAAFAVPHGIVAFIGVICCIAFLVEGAMMDWSGVFLLSVKAQDASRAGSAFAVFSAAMLTMRLSGDWLSARLGSRRIVLAGSLLSGISLLLVVLAPQLWLVYAGFFGIGIGIANVVPVFYSMLGRQTVMPIPLAVAAVSTLGYLGILMGPALIGLVAHQTSLERAFLLLAGLVALMMAIADYVYRRVI